MQWIGFEPLRRFLVQTETHVRELPIDFSELHEAMAVAPPGYTSYLDKETGEILIVLDEVLFGAEGWDDDGIALEWSIEA